MHPTFRLPDRLLNPLTLRQQILLVGLIGGLQLAWLVQDTSETLDNIGKSGDVVTQRSLALQYHQDADMRHDALHTAVMRALLLSEHPSNETAGQIQQELKQEEKFLREDLDHLQQIQLPEEARAAVADDRAALEAYAGLAETVVDEAFTDRAQALLDYDGFQHRFEEVEQQMNQVTVGVLAPAVRDAEEQAQEQRKSIRIGLWERVLVAMVSGTILISLLAHRLIHHLERIRNVAQQLGSGNLDVRNGEMGKDEVGDIARAFNDLGENLKGMMARNEKESERTRFTTQLADALEMADQETSVGEVVRRAMGIISNKPTSMMLADNSKAHMRQVASREIGESGCGVASPWACVAVRRATPMHFSSSESLNACPYLRGKPACSATCVPVSFMGKSVGVLHTVGPEHQATEPEELFRLTALANQAGARIGTIRAMEKIQLQVSTDSLTGLLNRRTLENKVAELKRDGVSYAVAMVDLDHFKKLNDTFGHEAGDRALRHFGALLRSSRRATDLCGRYGGEEFVLVFPETSTDVAVEIVNRLRAQLANSFTGDTPRFTLSCGVADTEAAPTFQQILRAADAAAYQAKQSGRDRVLPWEPGIYLAPEATEIAANQGLEDAEETEVSDAYAS